MRSLYQGLVCTAAWSTKKFPQSNRCHVEKIRGFKVDKLLQAMFANYMLLEGGMIAQIQVAYDLTMADFSMMQTKKKSYPNLRYDIKKMIVFVLVAGLRNYIFNILKSIKCNA